MRQNRLNKLISAGVLTLSIFAAAGCGQKSYFDSLPEGCDPVEVGKGITQLFIDNDKPERTTKKGNLEMTCLFFYCYSVLNHSQQC